MECLIKMIHLSVYHRHALHNHNLSNAICGQGNSRLACACELRKSVLPKLFKGFHNNNFVISTTFVIIIASDFYCKSGCNRTSLSANEKM